MRRREQERIVGSTIVGVLLWFVFLMMLNSMAHSARDAKNDGAGYGAGAGSAGRKNKKNKWLHSNVNLAELDYRVYPRRTEEEAAVLEWGHSAIISALDASVAHFGPQTTQAALLEVECMPILASPLNGVGDQRTTSTGTAAADDEETDQTDGSSPSSSTTKKPIIRPLDNADLVHGNMVVMTNNGGLSGVEMARVAKLSGAAALLVVNIDEERPDDIYRLPVLEGESADDIDIPVVMISLNSANVLTTATVLPNMAPADIVNHGMPERVRLYAGGDRPFFEDVEPAEPTLYLIHNLLTEQEVDSLVKQAESRVAPLEKNDILQLTEDAEKFPNVQRVMLWQGLLQTPERKAIEERIEQVTGFPASHYSDFVVDRLDPGAQWKPHYDTHPSMIPMATITIYLTAEGGSLVYPSCKTPVRVNARKGMAVVHHNTNDRHQLDLSTVHAMLSHTEGPVYVARKYVFTTPVSNARRMALPFLALPFGGKLPGVVVSFHDFMIQQFGVEQGGSYFDKACVFIPVALLLYCVQLIMDAIQAKVKSNSTKAKEEEKEVKPKAARTPKRGKKD